MKILAMETSSTVAGAAVIDGADRVLCAINVEDTKMHAQTMMPMAQEVLAQSGLAPADMDAFAVDIGPGSFTGIRIGVSAVNAMAMALGVPVVEVDALSALCGNVMGQGGAPQGYERVCAMLDARNGRVYAARFDATGEAPVMLGGMFFGEVADLLCTCTDGGRWAFVGDAVLLHAAAIAAAVPRADALAGKESKLDAAVLARIAHHKLLHGETVKEARPVYLARPQAERMLDGGI